MGKWGVKTFGLPFFNKILNPPKNVFVFYSTTSGENVSKIGLYLGNKDPKTSHKGPFHEGLIGKQNFEKF